MFKLELGGWDVAELAVQTPVVLCRCSGYADVGSGSPVGPWFLPL